jgi:hypothetical protein
MDKRLCVIDKNGVWNYDKVGLAAYTIRALQQLHTKVEDQQKEIEHDQKEEQRRIADLKRLIAAQQKEIELMKWQIRILAEPHPAQVHLPDTAP